MQTKLSAFGQMQSLCRRSAMPHAAEERRRLQGDLRDVVRQHAWAPAPRKRSRARMRSRCRRCHRRRARSASRGSSRQAPTSSEPAASPSAGHLSTGQTAFTASRARPTRDPDRRENNTLTAIRDKIMRQPPASAPPCDRRLGSRLAFQSSATVHERFQGDRRGR